MNDFEKERANNRKLSLFSVIGGALGIFLGYYLLMVYEKTYYDNDAMGFLTFAMGAVMILFGIILLICAVLFPILSKKTVGKNVILVYDDHVEGTARRYVNNYGKFQGFNLKHSDIESVRCKAVTVSSAIVRSRFRMAVQSEVLQKMQMR